MKKIIAIVTVFVLTFFTTGITLADPIDSDEKRSDEKQPTETFQLNTVTQNAPLYNTLSENCAEVKTAVSQKLKSKEPIEITLISGSKERSVKVAVDTTGFEEAQFEVLTALLVPDVFVQQKLYGGNAPPAGLSEEQLCSLRDDCYALIDALNEMQIPFNLSVPCENADLSGYRIWQYTKEQIRVLEDWAADYCPKSEMRAFEEEYEIVYGLFIASRGAVQNVPVQEAISEEYIRKVEAVAESVRAGTMRPEDGFVRINDLWKAYGAQRQAYWESLK